MVEQIRQQEQELRTELVNIVKENVLRFLKRGYKDEIGEHKRIWLYGIGMLNYATEPVYFILQGKLYDQLDLSVGPVSEVRALELADMIPYEKGRFDLLLSLAGELETVLNEDDPPKT